MSGKDNLKIPTSEEARENGKKGGIASGEARREKKFLSQIYAEILSKKHKLKDGSEITGEQLIEDVVLKVLDKGDSSSVSMIKELREATEGSKVNLSGEVDTSTTININGVKTES